jgi:hypothetical protein
MLMDGGGTLDGHTGSRHTGAMSVFGAIAETLALVGSVDGRAGPAGLFTGLFVAPALGWPHGVQEEDGDRPWRWDGWQRLRPERSMAMGFPTTHLATTMESPAGVLIDLDRGAVPVHPCRRGKIVLWSHSQP